MKQIVLNVKEFPSMHVMPALSLMNDVESAKSIVGREKQKFIKTVLENG